MIFDVIVVGAGAAGCTVARELAEKQNKKVLILERRITSRGIAMMRRMSMVC